MSRLALVCLLIAFVSTASTQTTIPRVPDAATAALWHCDEATPGTLLDASFHNTNGIAYGTKVVTGRAGLARSFNGVSDYILVADPADGSLGFAVEESFTVECWFNTSSPNAMELIRKGLAPEPGYTLIVSAGKVVGIIGNRADGASPDTLLIITSDSTYNDGAWHHAMLIRDRAVQKLFLYVDDRQATKPITDTFPYNISSTRPLTIGRWENEGYPYYFDGAIDEVRITRDARHPKLYTPLMAVWNFEDISGGYTLDSTLNYNHGLLIGTSPVPGLSGSARRFNGSGDYILVNDAENGSLDFDSSQSFTVEAWFKTTSSTAMQLLRKGLAPDAGYGLFVSGGYADAVIGNREDGTHPDTLLIMHSMQKYNDGAWHRQTLVRDRSTRKVYLYVDGRSACMPLYDAFPYAIASGKPLTIGRWEYPPLPYYFQGDVDQVRITRGAVHPAGSPAPGILVQAGPLDWGSVTVGDSTTKRLTIFNSGTHDTLSLTAIGTTPAVFIAGVSKLSIAPFDTASIVLRYKPSAARRDSGWVTFTTNDTARTSVSINLLGRGLAAAPVTMILPLNQAIFNKEVISFSWQKPRPVPTKYWFEWSASSAFTNPVIDTTLTDTLVQKAGFTKNATIYWRVRAGSALGWGEFNGYRSFFRTTTAVETADRPTSYELVQNYPNPFNPSTTITFRVPEAASVRLEVFNAAGELVRVAAEGFYPAGEYRILFDATGLPSGTYFARMRTGSASMVRPMLLMK